MAYVTSPRFFRHEPSCLPLRADRDGQHVGKGGLGAAQDMLGIAQDMPGAALCTLCIVLVTHSMAALGASFPHGLQRQSPNSCEPGLCRLWEKEVML